MNNRCDVGLCLRLARAEATRATNFLTDQIAAALVMDSARTNLRQKLELDVAHENHYQSRLTSTRINLILLLKMMAMELAILPKQTPLPGAPTVGV